MTGRSLLAGLLLALVLTLLNLSLLPFAFVSDDLQFATGMDRGETEAFEFWLPSRLLWQFTGHRIHRAARALGGPAMALPSVQGFNAAVAGLSAGLFFLGLYRLTGSAPAALTAALGLAFSYYFWGWSVRVKMYPLHLLCLMVVLFAVLEMLRPGRTGREARAGALAGLFAAFALYYHQSAWLFYPPAAGAVATVRGRECWRFLLPGAGAFLVAMALFAAIYHSHYRERFPTFLSWYTFEWRLDFAGKEHIGLRRPDWNRIESFSRDVLCGLLGSRGRDVYIRYPYAFSEGSPESIHQDRFEPFRSPAARRLLDAVYGNLDVLYRASAGVLLVFGAALTLAALLQARRLWEEHGAVLMLLAAAAAVYWAGFLLFDWTGYLYYAVWLFAWGAAGVILGTMPRGRAGTRALQLLAGGAVAVLFLNNFVTGVFPQAFPDNHRVLRDVLHYRHRLDPGALLILTGRNPAPYYWSYFARRQTLDVTLTVSSRGREEGWRYLVSKVDRALEEGRPVYVDGQVFRFRYRFRGEDHPELGPFLEGRMRSRYRLAPGLEDPGYARFLEVKRGP